VARELWAGDVAGIGVGIAGLVAWPEGEFVWGPHVAGTRVPVRAEVEAELAVPVVVDNDANMAAWCELHLGAGRGYRNMLLVTLGTGIGGALVIDGRLYRGRSFAGEWGHMLFDPAGPRCHCGKRGCWETVASGPAVVRLATELVQLNPEGALARRLAGVEITGESITRAADEGDETARVIVAQVGADLGRGLCNLLAILDPEIIVVGGGLGSVGEGLLGPARRIAADALHGGSYRELPPIVRAERGPASNAVGAALMAQDASLERVAP
jgi:glucokinase